jgi:hypothetical protein
MLMSQDIMKLSTVDNHIKGLTPKFRKTKTNTVCAWTYQSLNQYMIICSYEDDGYRTHFLVDMSDDYSNLPARTNSVSFWGPYSKGYADKIIKLLDVVDSGELNIVDTDLPVIVIKNNKTSNYYILGTGDNRLSYTMDNGQKLYVSNKDRHVTCSKKDILTMLKPDDGALSPSIKDICYDDLSKEETNLYIPERVIEGNITQLSRRKKANWVLSKDVYYDGTLEVTGFKNNQYVLTNNKGVDYTYDNQSMSELIKYMNKGKINGRFVFRDASTCSLQKYRLFPLTTEGNGLGYGTLDICDSISGDEETEDPQNDVD